MELRVNSWLELQEVLFDSSWRLPLQRFRSNYVFRGTPRASHGLEAASSVKCRGSCVAKCMRVLFPGLDGLSLG